MRILNFGSINVDHVYSVPHFVRPGETLGSTQYQQFSGGKGFNQSVALARGGARVCHAGKIGKDGLWLKDELRREGVDTRHIAVADGPTGHAIIQVAPGGENSIILYGGANRCIAAVDVKKTIRHFERGDWLLIQNEITAEQEIIRLAHRRGLRIVLNPAPMTPQVQSYPLQQVDIFILNEIEAGDLTGESETPAIMRAMRRKYPRAATVLTLGAEGVKYRDAEQLIAVPAVKVKAVDTTAAGDTFIGFFLSQLMAGSDIESALRTGCQAAAICVTRQGAAASIPRLAELALLDPPETGTFESSSEEEMKLRKSRKARRRCSE